MNKSELMKQDFLPVLLGSDINAYGMARSFHEAYGYKSVAVGKGRLPVILNSHIVEVQKVEPRLEEDEIFVSTLTEFAKRYEGVRLLLVPCGDNYIKMLVRNQDALRGIYEFECIDEALLMRLSLKESFYEVCEEHGFSFPKTTTCSYENYKETVLPFDFPVIIKPSNSVAYWIRRNTMRFLTRSTVLPTRITSSCRSSSRETTPRCASSTASAVRIRRSS